MARSAVTAFFTRAEDFQAQICAVLRGDRNTPVCATATLPVRFRRFSRRICLFPASPLLLAGFIASGFLVGLTFRSHSNRRKHFEQGVKSGDPANGASRTDGCFTFFGKAAGIVEPGQEYSMSHRPGRIPRSGLLRAKASTSEPSSRNILRKGFAVARAGTDSEWIFPEGVFCGGSPWVRIMEIGSMNGRQIPLNIRRPFTFPPSIPFFCG